MSIDLTWQIAMGIHLLFTTAFSLCQRYYAKDNAKMALPTIALMYIFVVSPAGILWALGSGDIDFNFDPVLWFFLILGGLLFAFGNFLGFSSNAKVDAAQFGIISNLRIFTTVLVSSIILNETLDSLELLGVVFIFVAATVIASLHISKRTGKIDRYTLFALLSAIFFGVAITNEKYLLDNMTFDTYLIVGWGFQTLAMAAFALPYMFQNKVRIKQRDFTWILLLGALRTIAGFALVQALVDSDNSSLVSGVMSYKTALVVIGSYFILREYDHIKTKLLATLLATIGLLLLI